MSKDKWSLRDSSIPYALALHLPCEVPWSCNIWSCMVCPSLTMRRAWQHIRLYQSSTSSPPRQDRSGQGLSTFTTLHCQPVAGGKCDTAPGFQQARDLLPPGNASVLINPWPTQFADWLHIARHCKVKLLTHGIIHLSLQATADFCLPVWGKTSLLLRTGAATLSNTRCPSPSSWDQPLQTMGWNTLQLTEEGSFFLIHQALACAFEHNDSLFGIKNYFSHGLLFSFSIL